MLPQTHRQIYEAVKQRVMALASQIANATVDQVALKAEVIGLQHFFQEQLLPLPLSDLPLELEQRVQSYQVEMDKQLRLLNMDVMFLQAARQAATSEHRRKQVSDRLNTLSRYCDALLQTEGSA